MTLQDIGGSGEVMALDQGGTVWDLGGMGFDHDASLVERNSDILAQDNRPWDRVAEPEQEREREKQGLKF